MNERIVIEKPEDWERFRNNKLNVIVDPMIFRTADVFSRNRLRKEFRRITADVIREIGPAADQKIKATAKVTGKVSFVGPIPVLEIGGDVGAEMELNPGFALGWILRNLPGHRYRKLLLRLVMAQREYWHLDTYLKGMWMAPQ
jgi:hypothetical protein